MKGRVKIINAEEQGMNIEELKKVSQANRDRLDVNINKKMAQDAFICNPSAIAKRLTSLLEREVKICAKKGEFRASVFENLYRRKTDSITWGKNMELATVFFTRIRIIV
jgi:hypothetical protein